MSEIKITFNPQGFAECLDALSDEVQSVAETIAARAESCLNGPGSFEAEMTSMARFHDAEYGVTRPVAYVYADEAATKEEAENKILSQAVSG